MGGILKIDSAGNRIPAGSSTPVADRILFIGLEGGFELSGIGGLTIKLAFSELGPLSVMITGTSPEGVVLNGATGLTIKGFTAGVEFFKTLPAISEPEELRGSAFNIMDHNAKLMLGYENAKASELMSGIGGTIGTGKANADIFRLQAQVLF